MYHTQSLTFLSRYRARWYEGGARALALFGLVNVAEWSHVDAL